MNLERIASLLANGLKPANVATIVGCTPAYISQLAKTNQEFQNILASKQADADKESGEDISLGAKYQAAEHTLLERIMELSSIAEMRDLTNALRVVSERQEKVKARLNPIIEGQAITQNIIQISIPTHALPELCMTREQEVLSVNNLNLAPLTSTGVINLFRDMKENQDESARIPRIAEEIPQNFTERKYEEVNTLEDFELAMARA
jgi:hypothetical protein